MKNLRFPFTIFLSAFLLFQIQPMMGRYILPWFGGTPAIWGVCLLFFQALLLAGYAYAHWLGSLRNPRVQSMIHMGLLAVSLAALPAIPSEFWKPSGSDNPSGRILLLLLASVGAPYFLLASTTPLVQRWYHLAQPDRAGWRLYALSNLGSFLALFSYPFLMEPYVRLRTQSWIWSALYVVFLGLCGFTAWKARTLGPQAPEHDTAGAEARPSWATLSILAGAGGHRLHLADRHHEPDHAGHRGGAVPMDSAALSLSAEFHPDV